MRNDYCHITVLVDQSSSMLHLQEETIANFNKFLRVQQAVKGKATLTVVLFDTVFKTLYDAVDIQTAKPLDKETYNPNGWTALLDATATTIDRTGEFLAALHESERPSKVVFVTITDGEENSSLKYSYQDVKNRVQHQTDRYNWQFVFMGANIDSYATGARLGYTAANTSNFTATTRGIGAMYTGMYCKLASYREGTCSSMGFSVDEKAFIENAK